MQKCDAAGCNRLISNHIIVEAGHENDWIGEAIRGQLMGQFHPRDVTELDIHDKTGRLAR